MSGGWRRNRQMKKSSYMLAASAAKIKLAISGTSAHGSYISSCTLAQLSSRSGRRHQQPGNRMSSAESQLSAHQPVHRIARRPRARAIVSARRLCIWRHPRGGAAAHYQGGVENRGCIISGNGSSAKALGAWRYRLALWRGNAVKKSAMSMAAYKAAKRDSKLSAMAGQRVA